MSYYQGDWYRGDFYRGDPGFFGFLKNIAGVATGFIPGVGPLISGAIKAIPGGAPKVASQLALPLGSGAMATAGKSLIRRGVAAVKGHPVLSAAGAAGAIGAASGVMGQRLMGTSARMRTAVGGRRRRRMNVCNPRALRRAIRRTHGFAKLAMRTVKLVHPQKKARFGGFRRRRTRARS